MIKIDFEPHLRVLSTKVINLTEKDIVTTELYYTNSFFRETCVYEIVDKIVIDLQYSFVSNW